MDVSLDLGMHLKSRWIPAKNTTLSSITMLSCKLSYNPSTMKKDLARAKRGKIMERQIRQARILGMRRLVNIKN